MMVRISYPCRNLLFKDLQLNKKLFKVKMRAEIVAITFVATFLLTCLSNYFFSAFIRSAFMILVYKDLIVSSLCKKSVV